MPLSAEDTEVRFTIMVYCRSSCRKCSILKNFLKFTGEHFQWVSLLVKLQVTGYRFNSAACCNFAEEDFANFLRIFTQRFWLGGKAIASF